MNKPLLAPADLQTFMQQRGIPGEILLMDIPTPTVAAAAKAAGVEPQSIIKSILFLVKDRPVLAIASGTLAVERRAIAHLYGIGRKQVRLASAEELSAISGFEIGGMPPFGHREAIPTLLDLRVMEQPVVLGGGGAENALLRLDPQVLLKATSAQVVDLHSRISASRPPAQSGAASIKLLAGALLVILVVLGYFALQWGRPGLQRSASVIAFLRDPQAHSQWTIAAGERCGEAPFTMPTSGLVGYLWDDSFRPGHRHQGIDIFGGAAPNQTPVLAAYAGYLTRLPDWKSTVIIRIPDDPLSPGRQIWTYYTHMASQSGESFIADEFPPGTYEVFVEQGIFLGMQGSYSGDPVKPTGLHLHFSIVMDDGQGKFRNELEIENTLDPSPYLGLQVNARQAGQEIPVCQVSTSEIQ
jgi:peptidoglycan LD-endopeptidase LytH